MAVGQPAANSHARVKEEHTLFGPAFEVAMSCCLDIVGRVILMWIGDD
jgi:hypothetical protein